MEEVFVWHFGMLLLQGDYGPWGGVIALLRGLVLVAGGVGFVVGWGVKALAGPNSEAQELGNRILAGTLAGLLLGLLAEPLYNLFVHWTAPR
jgi:hypothetical protein